MTLVPHIVGQHLAGEALVGYEEVEDFVFRKPRLRLLGGGAVVRTSGISIVSSTPKLNLIGRTAVGAPPPGPRFILAPKLDLLGKPFLLEVSQTFTITANGGHLYLLGQRARGREAGMVPTDPEDIILYPTEEEDFILIPTTEEHWLLVPTTERDL